MQLLEHVNIWSGGLLETRLFNGCGS